MDSVGFPICSEGPDSCLAKKVAEAEKKAREAELKLLKWILCAERPSSSAVRPAGPVKAAARLVLSGAILLRIWEFGPLWEKVRVGPP